MKYLYISVFIILVTGAGCSTVKVVPDQVPNGLINPKDSSQTITRNNIKISISSADAAMVNYSVESTIASFNVDIENNSDAEVTFDNDSFVLIDSASRQYYSLSPDKIREMMAKDTYYLLPYPYVGFYYQEDYEQSQFKNSTSSNLPYYFELRPQELYTKALSNDAIIPDAATKGLIYFNTDLNSMTSIKINVYKKGTSKSSQPDFVFPFRVVK